MNSDLISRYLHQAIEILEEYRQKAYPKPLHVYLRTYFKEKKRGSRDRRILRDISFAMCRYAWVEDPDQYDPSIFIKDYRVLEPVKEYFPKPSSWPQIESTFPKSEWDQHITDEVQVSGADYLTFNEVWLVPEGANLEQLKHSLIKRGIQILDVDETLKTVKVTVESISDWTDAKPWRVQDYGARYIIMSLPIEKDHKVWDCCAGGGGKSLTLLHKTNYLNISDKRKKVLESLTKRKFTGKEVAVDSLNPLVNKSHPFMNDTYQWIIADVPCSGSGTWRKNPEHFLAFKKDQILEYQTTQRKIIESLLPVMKPGTKLAYITCSLFQEENEGQLEFFKALGLTVNESGYHYFKEKNSDFFYRCILEKLD